MNAAPVVPRISPPLQHSDERTGRNNINDYRKYGQHSTALLVLSQLSLIIICNEHLVPKRNRRRLAGLLGGFKKNFFLNLATKIVEKTSEPLCNVKKRGEG